MIRWFKARKQKRPRSGDAAIFSDDDSTSPVVGSGRIEAHRPPLATNDRADSNASTETHGRANSPVCTADATDSTARQNHLANECNGLSTANSMYGKPTDAYRRVTFKDEGRQIGELRNGDISAPGNYPNGSAKENLFDESLLDALKDGRLSFTDFLLEPKLTTSSPQPEILQQTTEENSSRQNGSLAKSIDDLVDCFLKETEQSADGTTTSVRSQLNISLTRISVQRGSECEETVEAALLCDEEQATKDKPWRKQRLTDNPMAQQQPTAASPNLSLVDNKESETVRDLDPVASTHHVAVASRPVPVPRVMKHGGVHVTPRAQTSCRVLPPADDDSARPATSIGSYSEFKSTDAGQGVERQEASRSMSDFPRPSSRPTLNYPQQLQARFGSPYPDHLGRGSACSFRDFAIIEDQIGSSPGSFANIDSSGLQDDALFARQTQRDSLQSTVKTDSNSWLAHETHVGSPSPCHSAVIVQQGNHAKRTSCLSSTFVPSRPNSGNDDRETTRPPSLCSRRSNDASFDLYIPPPPPIEEDVVIATEAYDMEATPFNFDQPDDISGSPTLTPYSSLATGLDLAVYPGDDEAADDPIIHSLLTLLPIREEQDLLPVLSQAVGEIVTEIISTRRKFAQLSEALEENKSLLRQQSATIERQNKDIEQLKSQLTSRGCAERISTTTSSSVVHRRSGHFTASSQRESRQSQELRELNCTLESILFQCTTLQRSSQDEATLKLFEPVEGPGAERTSMHVDGHMTLESNNNIKDVKNGVNADGTRTLLLRREPAVVNHMAHVVPPRSCVRHVSCELNPSDEKFFP